MADVDELFDCFDNENEDNQTHVPIVMEVEGNPE